jgi:putative phage-type endonuclease
MADQRTQEWFAKRAGLITGSRVKAIAAGTTSQTAKNLLATLKWERRNGVCAPTYCNDDMERGTALEGEAREQYEIDQLVNVDEVDFIIHPDYDFIGISPDGLVGDDGLVEIKCPAETSAHLHQQHIDGGYYAKAYKHQINLQLACTGRKWCDVVSWYPVEGEKQPLAIHRVERDEKAIEKLIAACIQANEKIEE